MRRLSPMSWAKLRRRSRGYRGPDETDEGVNKSGMAAAVIHALSDSRRTSFAGNNRPSRFHSASVSKSTAPYSFPPTRTIHRSDMNKINPELGRNDSALFAAQKT